MKEKLHSPCAQDAALLDVAHPIAPKRSIPQKREQRLDDGMPGGKVVDFFPLDRRITPKSSQDDLVLRERKPRKRLHRQLAPEIERAMERIHLFFDVNANSDFARQLGNGFFQPLVQL